MESTVNQSDLFAHRSFLSDFLKNPNCQAQINLRSLTNLISTSTELGYNEYMRSKYNSALVQYTWARDHIDECVQMAEETAHKIAILEAGEGISRLILHLHEILGIDLQTDTIQFADPECYDAALCDQDDCPFPSTCDKNCSCSSDSTAKAPENPFLEHFRQKVIDPSNPDHAFLYRKEIYGYHNERQSVHEQMFLTRTPIRGDTPDQAENNCYIMLFGPVGTGKTSWALDLSKKMNLKLLQVTAADTADSYYGNNILKIQAAFAVAKSIAPAIIFFDEMENQFPRRNSTHSEMKSENIGQFLTEMNFVDAHNKAFPDKQIILISASNHPGLLDEGAWRRCELHFHVGLPSKSDRRTILQSLLASVVDLGVILNDVDWETVLLYSEGFSPADLSVLARNVKRIPYLKTQVSKYFIPVKRNIAPNGETVTAWMPCAKSHPSAFDIDTLRDVDPAHFIQPPITAQDIVYASSRQRPSNDCESEKGMVKSCIKFNKKWGVNTNATVLQLIDNEMAFFDSAKYLEVAKQEMSTRKTDSNDLSVEYRAIRDGLVEKFGEWITSDLYEKAQRGQHYYDVLKTPLDPDPTKMHFQQQVAQKNERELNWKSCVDNEMKSKVRPTVGDIGCKMNYKNFLKFESWAPKKC